MKPTPDIEAKGLKAYEQVQAYERLKGWRLPLTYCAFGVIPAGCGIAMWTMRYTGLAWANFVLAAFLAWLGRFQWKQLIARHANNLRLLSDLEAEYGDQLSWVQVEKHLAELEKLKQEVADGSNGKS